MLTSIGSTFISSNGHDLQARQESDPLRGRLLLVSRLFTWRERDFTGIYALRLSRLSGFTELPVYIDVHTLRRCAPEGAPRTTPLR